MAAHGLLFLTVDIFTLVVGFGKASEGKGKQKISI